MAEPESPGTTATTSLTTTVERGQPIDVVQWLAWAFIVELLSIAMLASLCLWLKPVEGSYAIATETMKILSSFATLNFGALATAAKVKA